MDKNKEVIATTTSEGETGFMVCRTEANKEEKTCTDIENAKDQKTRSTSSQQKSNGMLDNNTYNLLEQLNIENKSLWRIKNNYKKDASQDNESKQIWSFLEKDKEEIVKLLTERLRERL